MAKKRKSVRERYKGQSFAKAAETIDKKYAKRSTDPFERIAFEQEMRLLFSLQEEAQAKEASINTLQENRRVLQTGGMLDGAIDDAISRRLGFSTAFLPVMNQMGYAPRDHAAFQLEGASLVPGVPNIPAMQAAATLAGRGTPTATPGAVSPLPSAFPALNMSQITTLGTPVATVTQNTNTTSRAAPYTPMVGQPNNLATDNTPITSNNVMRSFTPAQSIAPGAMPTSVSSTSGPTTLAQRASMLAAAAQIQPTGATQGGNAFANIGNYLQNNVTAPLVVGKGIETLGKLAMIAGGYEKVDAQFNPFEGDVRRAMAERNINLDGARAEIDAQSSRAIAGTSNLRNEATRQALNQNAYAGSSRALAGSSLQQQQINNQFRGDYAQTLNSLGQQRVQATNYAEQLNNQSQAGYQSSVQNILESVGGAGQTLTNFRAGVAQQRMLAEALKTKDFELGDVGEKIMEAYRSGKISYDDAIRIKDLGKSQADAELARIQGEFRQSFQ